MIEKTINEKLPKSKQAEQNCLGIAMKDPAALATIVELTTVDDYYWREHRLIIQAIRDLYLEGRHVDAITVSEKLESSGDIKNVNGRVYINTLFDASISQDKAEDYANIVKEKSSLRRIIQDNEAVNLKIMEGTITSPVEIIDKHAKTLTNISSRHLKGNLLNAADMETGFFSSLENAKRSSDALGVRTGLRDLDYALSPGLHRKEVIIVAARMSVGKTAFALQMALNVAIEQNKPSLFFSLEMPKEAIMYRALASLTGIDSKRIRRNNDLSQLEFDKLVAAYARLKAAPLFIDDTPITTVLEMKAKSKKILQEYGDLGVVTVDYISKVSASRKREEATYEVREVMQESTAWAKECNVPLVMIAQLNRATENNRNDPQLSNLAESDYLGRDADVVMLLNRPSYYARNGVIVAPDERRKDDGQPRLIENNYENAPNLNQDNDDEVDDKLVKIILAKNRNGETGTVEVNFDRAKNKFEDRRRFI